MIANIEPGNVFNKGQLARAIHIDPKTLKKNEQRILEELKECFTYEIEYTKTAKIKYIHFIYKLCDYEYEPQTKKKAAKNDFYGRVFPEIIDKEPYQTCANLSDIIWQEYPEAKELSNTHSTTYSDTLFQKKRLYGKDENDYIPFGVEAKDRVGYVVETVWGFKNPKKHRYEPLTEAQEKELIQMLRRYAYGKEAQEEGQKIQDQCEAGLISREEKINLLGTDIDNRYQMARRAFRDKYGMWPVRVQRLKNYDGADAR